MSIGILTGIVDKGIRVLVVDYCNTFRVVTRLSATVAELSTSTASA